MSAKDLRIRPIDGKMAARFVRRHHYSGKAVNNSQLHFGVLWSDKLAGVLQFGPSMDKRRMQGLVQGTGWNDFLELNRMAFSNLLPRNSESRALSVSARLIKKYYPHIKWIVSFADATQCGDGTIYRAAGFLLTGISKNTQIIEFPDGLRECRLVLTDARRPRRIEMAKRYGAKIGGAASLKPFLDIGAKPLDGYMLRYVKLLQSDLSLTVPIIPYSKIDEIGAGMYKGKARDKQAMAGPPAQRQGSADRHAPEIA